MALKVSSTVIDSLAITAEQAAPHECCGILLGHAGEISGALPADNVHPSPETHFEIDPRTLIEAHRRARAGGPAIVGYYHSHPRGPAAPSATDRAMAAGDGMAWAIIGPDAITWWRDTPTGFVPLSLGD
ncbi:peptidase [Erythrobacter arachoides]|uniref:Peptidase n=1 Tax=Aurantiacibacter arachoides TaxID=1850444 RepID=A0A845A444_9SPHN|nr:M67 family metallopeptidase [Aurantiacibacter arachoides]MXO92369.1 peptidase [Aurantiacibacter arachoides]GGD57707.1 Mov34/MPN/PAD-1 [Aurantiacibacter arachoides]